MIRRRCYDRGSNKGRKKRDYYHIHGSRNETNRLKIVKDYQGRSRIRWVI